MQHCQMLHCWSVIKIPVSVYVYCKLHSWCSFWTPGRGGPTNSCLFVLPTIHMYLCTYIHNHFFLESVHQLYFSNFGQRQKSGNKKVTEMDFPEKFLFGLERSDSIQNGSNDSRLNSHYKAWIFKEMKEKRKTVQKDPKQKRCLLSLDLKPFIQITGQRKAFCMQRIPESSIRCIFFLLKKKSKAG